MNNMIYLAARYSRHPEMQEYAKLLQQVGYEVTSRWIRGSHEGPETSDLLVRAQLAHEDWTDLMAADTMLTFTEPPRSEESISRGGRHVEFGAAMSAGKRCIVVGYRENVFHCLPGVEFYEHWEQALLKLHREAHERG